MNKKPFKHALALFLAVALCFSLCACAKEEPNNTANETETSVDGGNKTQNEQNENSDQDENNPFQQELFESVRSWAAWSNEGVLKQNSGYKMVKINSAKDLDPYRQYLVNLSAAEEAMILSDKGGACVVLELISPSSVIYYSVSSVFRDYERIEILVNECFAQSEEEGVEPPAQPKHTFFAFYIPGEIYRGETIQTVFVSE